MNSFEISSLAMRVIPQTVNFLVNGGYSSDVIISPIEYKSLGREPTGDRRIQSSAISELKVTLSDKFLFEQNARKIKGRKKKRFLILNEISLCFT